MPKKPADHKKPKHAKSERFTWTSEDDETTIDLPYMENLPGDLIIDALTDDGGFNAKPLMRFVYDQNPDARGVLTFGELNECLEAWESASSISMGE